MRLIPNIALALVVGCACSTPPFRDASYDGPPAGPVWRLEVLSEEPCEPWDAIPLERAALPADPTPRVLWVYRAGTDRRFVDAVDAARLSFRHLVQPVIAPDGSLRLWGPDLSSITAVSRDGEFLWLAGPGVRSSEEGFYGHPMVDPEGTTWMVARPQEFGAPLPVLYAYRDGLFRPTMQLDILPYIGSLGAPPILSVGSTGQIVINPGPPISTCRGARAEWRGTGLSPSVRMQSGELWSSPGGGWLVDRRGAAHTSGAVLPDGVPDYSSGPLRSYMLPFAPDLFQLYLIDPMPARQWIGTLTHFIEVDRGSLIAEPVLTGQDSLWVITAGSTPEQRRFSHVVGGVTEGSAEITTGLAPTLPADDGSLLVIEFTSPPALIHLLTDGTIAWRVPLVNPDGTALTGVDATATVDRHGVFYAATGTGVIIAVQTDTLPPPDGTCMVGYCNARRDNAMYYPPE